MKYLSITQTAERWGISTRRIQILCGGGSCSRCYPHWHGLGNSGGRREASGREDQERQVYQKPAENEK